MNNIYHPLTGSDAPIVQVLRDLASQENCYGEPYDQMNQAANYIENVQRKFESANGDIENLFKQMPVDYETNTQPIDGQLIHELQEAIFK